MNTIDCIQMSLPFSQCAFKLTLPSAHLKNLLHTELRASCEFVILPILQNISFNKIQKPNLVLVSVCLICFNLLNFEIYPPAAKETSTTEKSKPTQPDKVHVVVRAAASLRSVVSSPQLIPWL